jgi:hypothetical protein
MSNSLHDDLGYTADYVKIANRTRPTSRDIAWLDANFSALLGRITGCGYELSVPVFLRRLAYKSGGSLAIHDDGAGSGYILAGLKLFLEKASVKAHTTAVEVRREMHNLLCRNHFDCICAELSGDVHLNDASAHAIIDTYGGLSYTDATKREWLILNRAKALVSGGVYLNAFDYDYLGQDPKPGAEHVIRHSFLSGAVGKPIREVSQELHRALNKLGNFSVDFQQITDSDFYEKHGFHQERLIIYRY